MNELFDFIIDQAPLFADFLTRNINTNITQDEFDTRFHEICSDTDKECSICQIKLVNFIKLECNHKFHKECIKTWFFDSSSSKTTCPECRDEVTSNNIPMPDQELHEHAADIINSIDSIRLSIEEISNIINRIN
jgi:hypothetical protein